MSVGCGRKCLQGAGGEMSVGCGGECLQGVGGMSAVGGGKCLQEVGENCL